MSEEKEKCGFYKIENQQIQSKEINSSLQERGTTPIKIPYCSCSLIKHDYTKEHFSTLVFAADSLRCGGKLDEKNCHIFHPLMKRLMPSDPKF